MKQRNFVLALATAALLPALAYAGDNSDVIRASFERAFNHEVPVSNVPSTKSDAAPPDTTNTALHQEPDQVRASFERDLNHEPTASEGSLANVKDDTLDTINTALRGEKQNTNISHH